LDKRVFPHHTPVVLYREEHVLLLEVPTVEDIPMVKETHKEEIAEAVSSQKLLLAFSGESTKEGRPPTAPGEEHEEK